MAREEDVWRPLGKDRIPVNDKVGAGKDPVRKNTGDTGYFVPSPRQNMKLIEREMVIEDPPARETDEESSSLMAIGPAATMALPMMIGYGAMAAVNHREGDGGHLFVYVSLFTITASAALSIFWTVAGRMQQRRQRKKREEKRQRLYKSYLEEKNREVSEIRKYNTAVLHQRYPSAASVSAYNRDRSELWNRDPSEKDFLNMRVGMGRIPFQVKIRTTEPGLIYREDPLADLPRQLKARYEWLEQVPVCVDLAAEKMTGLVGTGDRAGAVRLAHLLCAQIAASCSPADVRLVCFWDREKDDPKVWECMRFLPHFWSPDRQIRYMADGAEERRDLSFRLSGILREREQRHRETVGEKTEHEEWFVILFSSPELLEESLIRKYFGPDTEKLHASALVLAGRVEQLPKQCTTGIRFDPSGSRIMPLGVAREEEKQDFCADPVSCENLRTMGENLLPVRVCSPGGKEELADQIDFLKMYGVRTTEELCVIERWRRGRASERLRARLGRKGGGICYLDLHEKYHGPHGIIAGATGSGKSVLIESCILSLAIEYSPEELNFLLIDYKGGGTADPFDRLPHLAGKISNLSGANVGRALQSIKSENTRRQRILAEYGVNHADRYMELYRRGEAKEPLPHLVIIIDEFAELKREQPDFMQELVSVAQVGRSLGVHLILATQKPSGTVSENIWSNSHFRICLRVQSRQDSMDMLRSPDASGISICGRAILQVGNNEVYEMFQSAYCEEKYDPERKTGRSVRLILSTGENALPESRERTEKADQRKQIDAVIDEIVCCARSGKIAPAAPLWLPPLGKQVWIPDIRTEEDGIVMGVLDDPQEQRQMPLVIDPGAGAVAVCGGPGSGKSTFLYTFLTGALRPGRDLHRKKTEEDDPSVRRRTEVIVMNYGGTALASFRGHRQVNVYLDRESGMEEIRAVFLRMKKWRQNCGGILVIDDLGFFREQTGSRFDDDLMHVLREEGRQNSMIAVSAAGFGFSDIPLRMSEFFRQTFSLEQTDRVRYLDVLRQTHIDVYPKKHTPGRGITVCKGRVLEFQTALAEEKDFADRKEAF
uniref:FtsK/SpoIIIE domain-containing protein n=1 Tax=Eubacterium cellulosolvens TaxID=29322 RepID=UPI000489D9DD|nr:FtsK/SpoIIIE domain-containing protein [[Eubacterium] cellulosolvens]